MNAPLARYLVTFSPKEAIPLEEIEIESISIDEFAEVDLDLPGEPELEIQTDGEIEPEPESEIAVAVREAITEAEARRDAEVETLKAEHEKHIEERLRTERAVWVETEADVVSANLDTALAELRTLLSNRIADVLRPLVAEAVVAKAVSALDESIALIMTDDANPCLTLRGPLDLLEAIGSRRNGIGGMTFEVDECVELTMTCEGTRIETKLARALAAINAVES